MQKFAPPCIPMGMVVRLYRMWCGIGQGSIDNLQAAGIGDESQDLVISNCVVG